MEQKLVMPDLNEKHAQLRTQLEEIKGSLAVAFSGGIDSTLLLKVALDTLGKERVIAITSDSESMPRAELKQANALAKELGVQHIIVKTHEIENPDYAQNNKDRCYYCKRALFEEIHDKAAELGIGTIAYGENADDARFDRPGRKAAQELNVIAPLRDTGFSKLETRLFSKKLGLSNWDKPAAPCLSSRITHGIPVTVENLQQVEHAEEYLKALGFSYFRVRHLGETARVETIESDFSRYTQHEAEIKTQFQQLGFSSVSLSEQPRVKF